MSDNKISFNIYHGNVISRCFNITHCTKNSCLSLYCFINERKILINFVIHKSDRYVITL